jgi:dCMP deaminase
MKEERIEPEEFYMGVAHLLRLRSTCLRGKVGCLAVRDKRVIATGYNGAPPGQPHCVDLGCDVEGNEHDGGCRRAVHAEGNLIAFAAKHGTPLEGSSLFCTHAPCLRCAQLIVSAGIIEVVYETPYRLPEGLMLLDACNLPIVKYSA